MKKLVTVYGILSAVFLVFHVGFWWMFDWPASLQYMTADHRMLMQTFNFCMLPLFGFSTYVFLKLRDSVLSTPLGRAVLVLSASVYLLRAAAEPIFGNIHTGESKFFIVLCGVLGVLFLIPVGWGRRRAALGSAASSSGSATHAV